MSASSTASSSTSVYTTPAFWEGLWRTGGIQSVFCFIIAYIVYGHQPQVGASPDALVGFYDGERMRILIAAVFSGRAIRDGTEARGVMRTPSRMNQLCNFKISHLLVCLYPVFT